MGSVLEGVPDKRGVQKQIVLPWSRALQMTRENIFVRLGRSAITASGIFLGIAFLSAVLFGAAAARVKAQMDLQELGLEHEAGELQARIIWLAAMSLLVATVGIVNSMLMSVTERYKEIGTMKCLGALDRFVVKLFLIESSLQGVVGSVVGAFIGFMLAFLRALLTYHVKDLETGQSYWLTLRFFPLLPVLAWVLIALVVGILLSIIAAIYPAIRAARMEPVQAMRVEA